MSKPKTQLQPEWEEWRARNQITYLFSKIVPIGQGGDYLTLTYSDDWWIS